MNPLRAIDEMRTIKALLTRSEAIAREMGEEQPGAEHLLLAALDLPDGTARAAFARAGTDAEGLRDAVIRQHADALTHAGLDRDSALERAAAVPLPGPAGTGLYRAKASAQEVFQAAVRLAKEGRDSRIRGAHVVVAAASLEHGTVARALASLGVDRVSLIDAARAELAEVSAGAARR